MRIEIERVGILDTVEQLAKLGAYERAARIRGVHVHPHVVFVAFSNQLTDKKRDTILRKKKYEALTNGSDFLKCVERANVGGAESGAHIERYETGAHVALDGRFELGAAQLVRAVCAYFANYDRGEQRSSFH